ncbi:MAG: 6-carboxytetrahydropterin synthase [Armatimonadetes bacterium]|nr:6-carboxytetrahydropterin synthase [Armatimonadota bacterium]
MPHDASAKPVRLTRKVSFSAGHRYWLSSKTEAENRKLFGQWASPFNHGHNYVLAVTVEGTVEPSSGMVVNIKIIDDLLKRHVLSKFDQKSLNDEVPEFIDQAPSLENLLLDIKRRITESKELTDSVKLVHLRLDEMPTLYAELDLTKEPMLTITRSYEFAASHRLHSPDLSPEENIRLYGKCNNPAGHGHNYLVDVTVSAPVNAETGMSVDIACLDTVVNEQVVDRYDHKNLSEDLPEFKGRVASSEIVAQEIFNRLKENVPGKLCRVRLTETARNIFEVNAD